MGADGTVHEAEKPFVDTVRIQNFGFAPHPMTGRLDVPSTDRHPYGPDR